MRTATGQIGTARSSTAQMAWSSFAAPATCPRRPLPSRLPPPRRRPHPRHRRLSLRACKSEVCCMPVGLSVAAAVMDPCQNEGCLMHCAFLRRALSRVGPCFCMPNRCRPGPELLLGKYAGQSTTDSGLVASRALNPDPATYSKTTRSFKPYWWADIGSSVTVESGECAMGKLNIRKPPFFPCSAPMQTASPRIHATGKQIICGGACV